MRAGNANPKTKAQISEIRPKLFLLLQAEGTLSTLEIGQRLNINTNALGTVLRHSQLTFEVKDIQANNEKRRMVSLKSANAYSTV